MDITLLLSKHFVQQLIELVDEHPDWSASQFAKSLQAITHDVAAGTHVTYETVKKMLQRIAKAGECQQSAQGYRSPQPGTRRLQMVA